MARKPKTTVPERAANAEAMASKWLADGNYAKEIGANKQAEKCYGKAQAA